MKMSFVGSFRVLDSREIYDSRLSPRRPGRRNKLIYPSPCPLHFIISFAAVKDTLAALRLLPQLPDKETNHMRNSESGFIPVMAFSHFCDVGISTLSNPL